MPVEMLETRIEGKCHNQIKGKRKCDTEKPSARKFKSIEMESETTRKLISFSLLEQAKASKLFRFPFTSL